MTQLATERVWNVALRSQAADALEIAVYDVIGKGFWGDGMSAKDFLGKLQEAPKAKNISLRVNSRGGIVDDAKAMVNLLRLRAADGATITAYVDGLAASSAAYLLTAADRVVMPENAFVMVHEVRGGILSSTAKQMSAQAELMQRTNEQIADGLAAASARRGKNKTKEDFLAAFAKGDLYLDADEAIEWGLADEKLSAPVKVAACLADITGLDAPDALRAAPYVVITNSADPKPPAPAKPQTHPGPSASEEPPQNTGKEQKTMTASVTATMQILAIATVLGLPETATEDQVVNETKKLKAQAKLGADIEGLVGARGPEALGAVRALKQSHEDNQSLAGEVAKLKIVNARRDFESIRDQGIKDKKLTTAVAKFETDRFEAALNNEQLDVDARADRANEIAQELKGRLQVMPRAVSLPANQPVASGGGNDGQPVVHNGKAFEALKPMERKVLKDSNPELYNLMREDAAARDAI